MEHSAADSPFAWTAYTGSEVQELPEANNGLHTPEECFVSKDIAAPAVTVSVGKNSIWVTERESGRLIRVVRFEKGFPSYLPSWNEYGNSLRVVIAPCGSVAFYREDVLYLWRFDTGAVQLLGTIGGQPEGMTVSPKGCRIAAARQGSIGNWHGWLAYVWSLPEGTPVATLRWKAIYPGTFSELTFSDEGGALFLSTEVSAQSGSDFEENYGWDIGIGGE